MKTFSVNALTEMLERDRATIVRALRRVPPDATERKQPRWKMTTALAALDRLPGSHNSPPPRRASSKVYTVEEQFYETEAFVRASDAVVEITNAPKAERKAMAPRVFEKIVALITLYEKAEPNGKLSGDPLDIVQRLNSGLLHAIGFERDPKECPDELYKLLVLGEDTEGLTT